MPLGPLTKRKDRFSASTALVTRAYSQRSSSVACVTGSENISRKAAALSGSVITTSTVVEPLSEEPPSEEQADSTKNMDNTRPKRTYDKEAPLQDASNHRSTWFSSGGEIRMRRLLFL